MNPLWVKGVSGNPSGRPKIDPGVKEMARGYTKQAIETLGAIMGDPTAPHSARVRAADTLLDRAWGKAEATVNVKQVENARDLSTAEILAALASNGIAAAEDGTDQPRKVH